MNKFFSLAFIVLVLGCTMPSKPLPGRNLLVRNIDISSGCESLNTGTNGSWSYGNITLTTNVSTSNPCYLVESVTAYETSVDELLVIIDLFSSEGVCVQCIGYHSINYEIINATYDNEINITVRVNEEIQNFLLSS